MPHGRKLMSALALGALLVVGAALGVGDETPRGISGASERPLRDGERRDSGDTTVERTAELPERLREGAALSTQGRFELVGDRVNLYLEDGKTSFRVLENLALERVVRVLRESTDSRRWNVDATVTEYQGGNYVLLRRATVMLGEESELP